MDKIIFFHMNQLGDLLFSLPVVKAVREKYPETKLYSVVKKNLAELLKSTGLVDKVLVKDSDIKSKINLIKQIKKENINTAVLFSESPETLITSYLSGIKKRIGFKTASLSFLLTDKAEKTGVPSLANNIRLAEKAGMTNIQKDYCNILKTENKYKENICKWLAENNIESKNFVAVSLGASKRRQEKCLKPEVWTETLNRLKEKNIIPVVTGALWEKDFIKSITDKCNFDVKIFCSGNGLVETAAFLKESKFFIGIDSGMMHLAAALGLKCIALYGNTDPSQIGPQPYGFHTIIKKDDAKNITAEDILNGIQL